MSLIRHLKPPPYCSIKMIVRQIKYILIPPQAWDTGVCGYVRLRGYLTLLSIIFKNKKLSTDLHHKQSELETCINKTVRHLLGKDSGFTIKFGATVDKYKRPKPKPPK